MFMYEVLLPSRKSGTEPNPLSPSSLRGRSTRYSLLSVRQGSPVSTRNLKFPSTGSPGWSEWGVFTDYLMVPSVVETSNYRFSSNQIQSHLLLFKRGPKLLDSLTRWVDWCRGEGSKCYEMVPSK